MTQQEIMHRNISLYKKFVLFSEPLFWGPILITAIQKLGHMSLPSIYFMESAVIIICVALDIPSGALADLIGKRRLLIAGRILLLMSYILFASMNSPLMVWMANILWAIGISFQSGADVSLIYTSLKNGGSKEIFKKVEGQATGYRFALMGCCALFVGILAKIDLRMTLFLSIPPLIIPLISAWKFTEPNQTHIYQPREQWHILTSGIKFALTSKPIRWILGFGALIAGVSKIWFFTYNPYFELVHLDITYYGFIFFLLNMTAWIFSHKAYAISQRFSERACIIAMIALLAVPIITMGLIPWWPMTFVVLLQNTVRGFIQPFMGDFMNRHIDSEHIRTTVLSVRSSATNIISIASLSWFGIMTSSFDLLTSLIILGSTALLIGSISVNAYNRVFPKLKTPT